jgi:hypothetical protein
MSSSVEVSMMRDILRPTKKDSPRGEWPVKEA